MTERLRDKSYRGKRAVDLAVATVAALPAIPIGIVTAASIKLTSRGPVFFRQERVGLAGQPFRIWKFRTMVNEPNLTAIPDPSKITPVGRILRRLSLDELPQLINVIKGEMSIVGPRPTLAYQVERYNHEQRGRLAVRPGITGLAQVRGRNELLWSDRIRLDLEYVRRQSLLLDLRLMFESVTAVASGSGVEGHPSDDPIAAGPDADHTTPTNAAGGA